MATDLQLEANRLNAQKSTGPRSVEGKARSSQNALKSGIYAGGSIIRSECGTTLQLLSDQFTAEYHPITPTERSLVDILTRSEWAMRRCSWLETEVWRTATQATTWEEKDITMMGYAFVKQTSVNRLHRMRNAACRAFFDALDRLLRMRREDHQSVDPIPEEPIRRPRPVDVPEAEPEAAPAPAEPSAETPAAPETPAASSPEPAQTAVTPDTYAGIGFVPSISLAEIRKPIAVVSKTPPQAPIGAGVEIEEAS